MISLRKCCGRLALIGLGAMGQILAQTAPQINLTDGITPPGLTPGAPAGSYPLSNFENVNLFNGNFNFSLPLLHVQGRGEAAYTMTLAIEQHWRIGVIPPAAAPGHGNGQSLLPQYVPAQNWWPALTVGYSPGVVIGRVATTYGNCNGVGSPPTVPEYTVTRFTFIEPDGTEHELRDTQTNGQPLLNFVQPLPQQGPASCPAAATPSRGTVFESTDGTAITFVSDSTIIDMPGPANANGAPQTMPSGYLSLKSGTRYRIDHGLVSWIRDQHGNFLAFLYDMSNRLTSINDSLNRAITIQYDKTGPVGGGITCSAEGGPLSLGCDVITFPGVGGAQRQVVVQWNTNDQILRACGTGNCAPFTLGSNGTITPQQLFGGDLDEMLIDGQAVRIPVPQTVYLPDARKYNFSYDIYGELARVTLPTSGAVEYDMTPFYGNSVDGVFSPTLSANQPLQGGFNPWAPAQVVRALGQRRLYASGGSSASGTLPDLVQVYSYPTYTTEPHLPFLNPNTNTGGSTVNVITFNNGAKDKTEIHTFLGSPLDDVLQIAISQNPPLEGREIETDTQDSGSNQRKSIGKTWETLPPSVPWSVLSQFGDTAMSLPDDTRVCQTNTTLDGLTAGQIVRYDVNQPTPYNNPTDVYEYDYNNAPALGNCTAPPPSGYTRHTQTTYLTNGYDTTANVHIRDLPTQVKVTDGSGNTASQTTYTYDQSSLTSYSNLSNPASSATAAASYLAADPALRGNLTTLTRLIGSSGSATTTATYDIAGNVVTAIDPNSQGGGSPTIQYSYTDNFSISCGGLSGGSFAFRTKVTDALNHITTAAYDCSSGKPTSITDPNTKTTSYAYTDELDRLTNANFPDGGSTTFAYCDIGSNQSCNTPNSVTITKTENSCSLGNSIKADQFYDGLGRTIHNHQYEDGGSVITVDTVYDGLSRVIQKTNPYRSGDTIVKTQTTYDALDRAIGEQNLSDSSANYTAYLSNQTYVRDPAGKWRESVTDGLGRLAQVVEDVNVASGSAVANAFLFASPNGFSNPSGASTTTNYTYNALDKLLGVCQGGSFVNGTCSGSQPRTFGYDDLGRLTSAQNPENGLTSYTYDLNGNVLSVVQGGFTRNSSYDKLNRVIGKSYIDAGATSTIASLSVGTPPVTYTYDNPSVPNSIGRLTQVASSASTTNFRSYDPMGRVMSSSQTTGGTTFPSFNYSYNLAGGLETETYPSSRVVTTCHDSVGRIANLSGSAGGSSVTYAAGPTSGSNIQYTAHGAISALKLGNNLFETTTFTPQLQAATINLGSTNGASDVWGIGNSYGSSNNNGNLLSQTIGAPGMLVTQVFTYDSLNRVLLASENPSNPSAPACPDGGSNWCQHFAYDIFGNRTVPGSTGTGLITPASISTATNRITDSNWTYDAAGNAAQQGVATAAYKYDSENRIVAACTSEGPSTCTNSAAAGRTLYSYDGDGRRVMKQAAAGTTTYVYDASGELASEYAAQPATLGTEYLTADQLGSTRLITSATAMPMSRHDFRPFGDEILRSGVVGYGFDGGVTEKFTSKERDAETGLDFFGARYFSSAQGRFTSPDQSLIDQEASDPQSWNLYGYGRNNPLRYIDPTGQKCVDTNNGKADDGTGGGCEAAGVDKKGNITPQQFTVTASGNLFTEQGGTTFLVMDNGHRAPVAERSMQDDTLNLAMNLSLAGDIAKLGMVLDVGGVSVAKIMGVLREAAAGKGNFGLGQATAAEAEAAGKSWVGEGAKVASDGKTMVSQDGLKQYRPPTFKPNEGKVQANFEARPQASGQWQSNGHLDIK